MSAHGYKVTRWIGPSHVGLCLRKRTNESIAAAHNEHRGLIERILDRDAEGAAKHIGEHIDNAREGLAGMLKARDDLRSAVLSGKRPA